MTRYVENLNECTDPVAGDQIHIYDASAGSTDKDRRVNVGNLALPSQRNLFAVAQGLMATKSSVASGSATGICTLVSGGGGALMFAFLVAVEASGSGMSSAGMWAVTGGYSTIAATSIAQSLYGHSGLALAASIVTGTRTITLTVTQTNAGAGTNTIRLGVLPLASAVDGALTITSL